MVCAMKNNDYIFENVKFIVTFTALTKADINNIFKSTNAGIRFELNFVHGYSISCYFSSLMLYVT